MYDFPLKFDHPYLLHQRRLTYDTTSALGIGHYNNRILVSLHNPYGEFVNYVPRVLDNSEPKYDFSGLTKTKYLYNYHRARQARRQAVIVVEGFFGAAWLHQLGYPSVIALMGSNMSEQQEQLITRWWEHVIFMMDGDSAGRRAQKEFIERMNKRGLRGVYSVNLPDDRQPDHLNPSDIQALLTKPN